MSDEDIEELYKRYRAALQKFFLGRTRNPQAVDDLMQELYRCLLEYPPPAVLRKPQGYVFRVAWSVLNELSGRAQQHSAEVSSDPETLDQLAAEQRGDLWFEDGTRNLDTQEKLDRVLRSLPPTDRVAILLHRRDGLSYRAIAKRMNVTEHTVKKYIGRALRRFRHRYGRARPPQSTSED